MALHRAALELFDNELNELKDVCRNYHDLPQHKLPVSDINRDINLQIRYYAPRDYS